MIRSPWCATGGVRYDDYDEFDAETTWKTGLEFNVIPSLKLRGTYSTVFRAPTILDLFSGLVDSFPTYADPCIPAVGSRCRPDARRSAYRPMGSCWREWAAIPNSSRRRVIRSRRASSGRRSLRSGNFSATLDYWDIQIEEGISSLGVQFILDDCYIRQVAASCALVTREPNYEVDTVHGFAPERCRAGCHGRRRGVPLQLRHLDRPVGGGNPVFAPAGTDESAVPG